MTSLPKCSITPIFSILFNGLFNHHTGPWGAASPPPYLCSPFSPHSVNTCLSLSVWGIVINGQSLLCLHGGPVWPHLRPAPKGTAEIVRGNNGAEERNPSFCFIFSQSGSCRILFKMLGGRQTGNLVLSVILARCLQSPHENSEVECICLPNKGRPGCSCSVLFPLSPGPSPLLGG